MAETIRSNVPDPPISGSRLEKGTVAGRKAQFVFDSTTGTTSFTISTGATHTVSFNLGLWSPDLINSARSEDNIVDFDDCVAWAYENVYVTTALDSTMLLPNGSGLTAAQKQVNMSKYETISPNTYSGSAGYSATVRYAFENNSGSNITLYFYGRFKYIIYADVTL